MSNTDDKSTDLPFNLKAVFTIIFFSLFLIHALFPNIIIDYVSIALILLILFLWIFKYIQKITFPGGGGIEKPSLEKAQIDERIDTAILSIYLPSAIGLAEDFQPTQIPAEDRRYIAKLYRFQAEEL